ncbi:putative 3-hydroxyphenylpropionic transporter MhpT [Pseudovibrio axinellae]|uniref:Putative 3-hydroxyphenylpropionic transporter MhpT n=1 Tax=Pseudovibrio axinellae TaxID=989403 RepID=A0A165ZHR9_9HYPH|nr:MFS transporter [Pseudovibrio axinellae]KZL19908.1 putative 3-hydroxyphenylpropionic transporter MhpT [Pseudovibrio axinellae]SER37537.1 Predicted arabinose efflux permease, MFS family [Pseudovibrio axinellae]
MKLLILFFANFIASVAMGIALTIVPWELSNSLGGEKVLAFTATYASTVLIFLSPIAGRLTDSLPRRNTLVVCVVLMGVVLNLVSLAYNNPVLKITSLSVFYFASQIFFLFFYNSLTAFIQEAFAEKEHGKVNGWMQVEMQLSTLLAGLLMIYSIKSSDFEFILLINGFLLLLSALMLSFIPIKQRVRPPQTRVSKIVFLAILKRKDLLLLGVSANISFVSIMMLNVIHPIYFNSVLGLEVSSVAMISISFGVGAAASGFLISRIVMQHSALLIMRSCLATFTLSLLVMSLSPSLEVIVILAGILGATGSATRVSFNTYAMSIVDKNIFGSYLSVINVMTYIQRSVFGFLLALMIAGFPSSNFYWFVFMFTCLGLFTLFAHFIYSSSNRLELSEVKA